jgi:hypothetical protein
MLELFRSGRREEAAAQVAEEQRRARRARDAGREPRGSWITPLPVLIGVVIDVTAYVAGVRVISLSGAVDSGTRDATC